MLHAPSPCLKIWNILSPRGSRFSKTIHRGFILESMYLQSFILSIERLGAKWLVDGVRVGWGGFGIGRRALEGGGMIQCMILGPGQLTRRIQVGPPDYEPNPNTNLTL